MLFSKICAFESKNLSIDHNFNIYFDLIYKLKKDSLNIQKFLMNFVNFCDSFEQLFETVKILNNKGFEKDCLKLIEFETLNFSNLFFNLVKENDRFITIEQLADYTNLISPIILEIESYDLEYFTNYSNKKYWIITHKELSNLFLKKFEIFERTS